jgi:hypothetical protein
MLHFKDFILETTTVATDGKVTVRVPAIALAIYRVGKDITLSGKRYYVSKHGTVRVEGGMKYADLTLTPL